MLVYSLTRMKEHGMMERIGILVNKREREREREREILCQSVLKI